ncbi:MAG: DUF815 domain-containing protein, partial [Cyanobacteria bacterium J06635_11]
MGLGSSEAALIGQYIQQSASLLLYQSVLESSLSQALLSLLKALLSSTEKPTGERAHAIDPSADCSTAYGQWFSALANAQQSWQQHLISQILIADNAFSQQAQTQTSPSPLATGAKARRPSPSISAGLLAAAQYDLVILQALHQLTEQQLSQWVHQATGTQKPVLDLATKTSPIALGNLTDWATAAEPLAEYYASHGVGIFGQFTAFRWQAHPQSDHQTGQLVGIHRPDPIALRQLAAYDHPKQQLIQNTESLLRGYAAQNVLLYGSRGAGKSSLVKALLNEYATQGLRLIEVPKAN